MSGPRPAARTADEAAGMIWSVLLDTIRRHEAQQARSPSLNFDIDEGRIGGYVGALFLITGEPHDSVLARARMVALTRTSDDQPNLF